MANNPRTTEQKRAEQALNCIKTIRADKDEYKTLAKRAPADIHTNGLGQTLAFWRSKGKTKPADVLYNHVSKWVRPQMGWSEEDDLLEKLIQCSTSEYRQATIETMAFLNWLKRFAEAELESE